MGGYLVGRSSGTVSISPAVAVDNRASLPIVPQIRAPADTPASPPPPPQALQPVMPAPSPESTAPPTTVDPQVPQASEPPPLPAVRDAFGRININLASRAELMDLPGIGPSLSERIVEHRARYGFFNRIEDIRNVSGIGETRFEAIRDRITIG